MNPEVTWVDNESAPYARDQFTLADDYTRALDQHHQEIESTIAQRERNPFLFKGTGSRKESKRTK